jgi:diguanylate cyclase (GGDEF)-like protein
LIPSYFATVQPNQTARLVATGFILGALNLACAITLVRGLRGSARAMMWIAVSGFGALGLALVLRSAYQLLMQASGPQALSAETLMAVTILVVSLAQVTVAFGLIMLVAHRYAEKLNRLTLLDPLTGTLNRLGMERMGQRVLIRSRQSMRSVAVALVDADHFKAINDQHGHPVGDQVLVHLSNLLIAQVRPGDLVVRYGGEEFLLLLVGSGPESAFHIADRLRELVTQAQVITPAGNIRYKVSIGVSNTEKSGYTLAQLILDADVALYKAKQEGRNRVCVA